MAVNAETEEEAQRILLEGGGRCEEWENNVVHTIDNDDSVESLVY
jgi:hypothetical protein